MNLKRSIRILICCLAIMGTLSVNILTTEAAEAAYCTHPFYQIRDNVTKNEYHDDYWHYKIYGTEYSCPNCGHTYWENLRVEMTKHTWATKTEMMTDGKEAEITYCIECGLIP